MDIGKKLTMLETSPIRIHLKKNNKISLFDDESSELREIDDIISTNMSNLLSPLKIVVLGEVKAGKSTLVNSLIERKVSYTNVVEATSTIIEVKYSTQDKISILGNDDQEIILGSLGELDDLINSNIGDQDYFNSIKKIIVCTNSSRLKEITLVDTPGLNSVTVSNVNRTENYIANADVILWVLNSNHIGQRDVTEKIEDVLEYGKPVICVLNRVDEIDGDINELVAYVQNEMGYMFTEIFTTNAKDGWEGYIESDQTKVDNSNIGMLYDYIINNIENNSKQVQMETAAESIKTQLKRDIHLHRNIQSRLEHMLKSFDAELKELSSFNNNIKAIIENKISEWINSSFLEKEKQSLISCTEKEFKSMAKEYSENEYISGLIKRKYKELNAYILDEWHEHTKKFISKFNERELEVDYSIDSDNLLQENINASGDIVEGAKQGGAAAGAIGLGLAGYAALLGPAAAYVSIGSAIVSFCPPLLIAGTLGGAAWKLLGKDKKQDRSKIVNDLIAEIKSNVKSYAENQMKDYLKQASDHYYSNSKSMITSILEQCSLSIEEVENIIKDIDQYVCNVEAEI